MTPPELPEGAVSWRMLLAEAERRLDSSGVVDGGSAPIEARRIVERASGLEGSEYVLGLDEAATERGVHFFDLMLERRLAGEPLQYVVGRWGFRTLDLFVDRRVLIPRPETEVVAGLALAELDRRRPVARDDGRALLAVDLGTGSGAIGLSLAAECEAVEVWLTDRSVDAVAVARANLAGLGRAGTRVRLAEGDWFTALPPALAGAADVLVSNPPYVATGDDLPAVVRDWEPTSALLAGADGLDDLRVLVVEAPGWLRAGGALVVELDPRQAEPVAALALDSGFAAAEVHLDLAGRARAVVARLPDAT
ncbi:MAG TPA: peptide chain release factor N(5)-glutamine methyltransferase [Acidimicrobiales bacterium]